MNSLHPTARTPECDAIRELIPDYAFGLTDPEDTRLVESNLAHCSDAATQLADYRRLQVEMRAGVPQIEPPAALAERLMAAIDVPAGVPTKITVRRPQRFPIAWLVAAVAVMALLTTNLYWLTRLNNAEQPTAEATEYSGTQGSPALVLNTTTGLRWVHLPASAQNTKASAVLMWNAQSEIGLVYATGFPQLADGTTYQLWLTRGQDLISAGTFTVDQNGKGAMLFHITQSIDEFTWARITAEPIAGSPAPTGTVVVVGELTT
ncbi:MAG: anti-sigma factor [Aggregatilineales bacterium]